MDPLAHLRDIGARRDESAKSNESLVARVFRRMSGRTRTGWNLAPEAGAPGTPLVIRQSLLTRSGGVVELAACCSPVPNDELVGLLSGTGIVAHGQGCPGALEHVGERRIYLAWGQDVDLEQPLRLRVRTANMVGLLAEMSRVEALEQAVQSSRTALEATQAGFDVGTRTIVDVLDSQFNLYRAITLFYQARYDYLMNALRLKQAAGNLQIQDLEEIDRFLKERPTPEEAFAAEEAAAAAEEEE